MNSFSFLVVIAEVPMLTMGKDEQRVKLSLTLPFAKIGQFYKSNCWKQSVYNQKEI